MTKPHLLALPSDVGFGSLLDQHVLESPSANPFPDVRDIEVKIKSKEACKNLD